MPELPEVETIVRQLRAAVMGLRVVNVRVVRRDVVHGDTRPLGRVIVGRRVRGVRRRAKRVIVDFEDSVGRVEVNGSAKGTTTGHVQLVFHLGMSGRLCLHDAKEKCEPHTHVRIGFDGFARELRFRDPRRFGGVWCLTTRSAYRGKVLGELGPEPISLRRSEFIALMGRRRQVKALLLDQTVIAGLGNIYCDEAFFDAGIHPTARSSDVGDEAAARLLTSIKKTLRRAINHKGSTLVDYRSTDGEAGSFQRMHRVYGREGEACKRCGATIARLQVAGRSSFVCERCQVVR